MNVENLILESIKTINRELKHAELENIDSTTPLFQILDSLGTLDLILELEDRIQEHFGVYIAVANEESMDIQKTPFKTIATLETYLRQRIKDESDSL